MTSEAPQDVAALPQTEAGKRLLNWSAYDGVARLEEILAIEREAAAGLLDQNDRLREAGEELSVTGNHRPDCPRIEWRGVQPECDCGWSEARDAWDTAQKAARP